MTCSSCGAPREATCSYCGKVNVAVVANYYGITTYIVPEFSGFPGIPPNHRFLLNLCS